MINLKSIPKKSGVYYFISNNEIIYVGSSKNLYDRMKKHNSNINKGSNHGYKQDLYQFLQSNQITIEFQLTEDYRRAEQKMIEIHQPIFNAYRANTGCGARKGRVVEYSKEYNKKFNYESQKQYNKQLCNYNNEILTLDALQTRFRRKGIEHPVLEAKKFLINKDNI